MIFTVRDLGFEIGPFLLEGWWALAARAVCAAVIVFVGLLVGWLLRRKIFPALLARSWHFSATPILLRSLQGPLERMAFYSGLYLALTSLPWAIPGLTKFLFTAYKIAATLLFCQGLYNASEVADLLLASCSPEIRSNKTLRSLLDTTYKVLVIILGVATCAQIVGFPIGSIVAGAGLVGLTISLAAQESASNLFSGIVILLDKPFSIGDWITVGNVEGEVIDINFRSTRIRSMDHSVVIITNSQICASTVQNTKIRMEVSGGGKKPWRQKGTGHARQGSIRAPQWTHGGVALGPKPRSYNYHINNKVKRLALLSVLSDKAANGNMVVVDKFACDEYKTKAVVAMLNAVGAGKKNLLVNETVDAKFVKSAGNIAGVKTTFAGSVNTYDVLNADKLIISVDAAKKLEEVLG